MPRWTSTDTPSPTTTLVVSADAASFRGHPEALRYRATYGHEQTAHLSVPVSPQHPELTQLGL